VGDSFSSKYLSWSSSSSWKDKCGPTKINVGTNMVSFSRTNSYRKKMHASVTDAADLFTAAFFSPQSCFVPFFLPTKKVAKFGSRRSIATIVGEAHQVPYGGGSSLDNGGTALAWSTGMIVPDDSCYVPKSRPLSCRMNFDLLVRVRPAV
jgi:hypothetical protein